jgi:hypothetical protein
MSPAVMATVTTDSAFTDGGALHASSIASGQANRMADDVMLVSRSRAVSSVAAQHDVLLSVQAYFQRTDEVRLFYRQIACQ